jgi:hypothetical protein
MSEVFYVYEHLRNDTNKIFYVGKGSGDRCYKKIGRNQHWHNIVNSSGFTVRILVEDMSEELAFALEIERIRELREQGVPIVNYTDGGDGASGYKHTDEARAKISAKKTGVKLEPFSEEHKQKMSEAAKGSNNSMYGKEFSDEHRARLIASAKAKVFSAEHRENLSKAMIGHKVSAETRKKISEAGKGRQSPNLGKKMSDEQKNKISESLKGNILPEQTKTKISESLTGRRLNEKHKENLRKVALSRPTLTCPHCGKSGSANNMKRYHFDNCKKRVVIN